MWALVTGAPFVVAAMSGCVADGKSLPRGQRVTDVSKAQAQPAYYMTQSTVATARSADFDALWAAVQRVTRDAGYRTDRDDPRLGVYTTRSAISSQAFEPWRWNVGSLHALVEATLGTVRRTVRWDVVKAEDGAYVATPRVLVERWTILEHRITSAAEYGEIFALTREEQRNQRMRALDPSVALTEDVPTAYWYPIGRDADLERSFARSAQGRVGK